MRAARAGLYISRYTPPWASHLPILSRVMEVSKGPVMECGMGAHSTPIMHMFCQEQGRQLYSYEENPEWYKAHWAWATSFHKIEFVVNWDSIPIESQHWGVIFIDHAAERRAIDAIRAAKFADFVILHDSNGRYQGEYHYEKVYPFYTYRYIYHKTVNHTTILSNFIPVHTLWTI